MKRIKGPLAFKPVGAGVSVGMSGVGLGLEVGDGSAAAVVGVDGTGLGLSVGLGRGISVVGVLSGTGVPGVENTVHDSEMSNVRDRRITFRLFFMIDTIYQNSRQFALGEAELSA